MSRERPTSPVQETALRQTSAQHGGTQYRTQRLSQRHPWWRTADVVFGCSLTIGLLLQWLWPLSLGALSTSPLRHLLALVLLAAGSLLIVASKRALQRAGECSSPHVAPRRIVTAGPYRRSRNPLYAGLALCYAGLGFGIDVLWLLLLVPPTMLATQWLLIRPEERELERRFGHEFRQYKALVRRWF